MRAEEKTPFRVSDRARARILALAAERASQGGAVRLFAERTDTGAIELGLSFDERREGDEVVATDGLQLLGDSASLTAVEGHVLDYDSRGFTLLIDGDRP
jgi:Fe-S cluster assembly iron-binding protein IscA